MTRAPRISVVLLDGLGFDVPPIQEGAPYQWALKESAVLRINHWRDQLQGGYENDSDIFGVLSMICADWQNIVSGSSSDMSGVYILGRYAMLGFNIPSIHSLCLSCKTIPWNREATTGYSLAERTQITKDSLRMLSKHILSMEDRFTLRRLPNRRPHRTWCPHYCSTCEFVGTLPWWEKERREKMVYADVVRENGEMNYSHLFMQYCRSVEMEHGASPLIVLVNTHDALQVPQSNQPCHLGRPVIFLVGMENWQGFDGTMVEKMGLTGQSNPSVVHLNIMEGSSTADISKYLLGCPLNQIALMTNMLTQIPMEFAQTAPIMGQSGGMLSQGSVSGSPSGCLANGLVLINTSNDWKKDQTDPRIEDEAADAGTPEYWQQGRDTWR